MHNQHALKTLMTSLIPVCLEAGREIMDIYNSDFDVDQKDDYSPVTLADQKAEDVIVTALESMAPDTPIVAEERVSRFGFPKIGEEFFLVDPLDGTKEFIRRRKEFTVNIALVQNSSPVMGLVLAPLMGRLFAANPIDGALECQVDRKQVISSNLKSITVREPQETGIHVVSSKSHVDDELSIYLQDVTISQQSQMGSSVKFCLIAAGEADFYPRLGPTMEWDTAAGQAVLEAAGGMVLDKKENPLSYNKKDSNFKNSSFFAWGTRPMNKNQ